MDRQQMPFLFRFLSDSELYAFKDGQIISTFNKCGLFFCRKQFSFISKITISYYFHIRL